MLRSPFIFFSLTLAHGTVLRMLRAETETHMTSSLISTQVGSDVVVLAS